METKPIAFQFTKSVKKSAVVKAGFDKDPEADESNEIDFVTSVDGRVIESKRKCKDIGPLVIPFKNARKKLPPSDGKSAQSTEENNGDHDITALEKEAATEILAGTEGCVDNANNESAAYLETNVSNIAQGATIGKEPSLEDYNSIPVQEFSKALLRGMGWKDGGGIGKNGVKVNPFEAVVRPKGLGLGASAQAVQTSQQEAACEEQLTMVPGAFVLVACGKEKGLYGQVSSLDGEGRAVVAMAISGQNLNLLETTLQLVTKKHYKRNSKVLNQEKYDEYRSRRQEEQESAEVTEKRCRRERPSDGGSEPRRRQHHGDSPLPRPSHHKQNHSRSGRCGNNGGSADTRTWVRPQLRVRCIDKSYKDGRYYKEKLEVVDVATESVCVCSDAAGRLLEDVSTRRLETVVPRQPTAMVMLVRGSLTGEVGELLERDSRNCRATLQLLSDRQVCTVDFDDVCEYLGTTETDRLHC